MGDTIMNQHNPNFLVGDLVCLANARTQEVFTIDDVDEETGGRARTLFFCGRRAFYAHEIEPKPLQKGDIVRDLGSTERYEVTSVDGQKVDLVQNSGDAAGRCDQNQYRAVSPTLSAQVEPSFMVGDIVREKGNGEDDCFTVMELADGGRTVFLGGGLELQHTALEPEPFQIGNHVRSIEENLRGEVTNIIGDAVYFDGYILPHSECRRISTAWPCEKEVPKTKKRTLAKVLAEIRQADAKMLALRAQRKALKKEARDVFNEALKVRK
jgi:hypothetical protein